MSHPFSLRKSERINSKKQIDRLFRGGGSKAMSAFPLRMVYMTGEMDGDSRLPAVQMMVSVPKRYFKRAVRRNRIKRQVREAYRLNRHIIASRMASAPGRTISVCFIWTADRLCSSQEVSAKVQGLLSRLADKLYHADGPQPAAGDTTAL